MDGARRDNIFFRLHQLRSYLMPSSLSLKRAPHFSLTLDGYSQVTSPLRRYVDLILHRQIKAHLLGKDVPYSDQGLQKVRTDLIQRERVRSKCLMNACLLT